MNKPIRIPNDYIIAYPDVSLYGVKSNHILRDVKTISISFDFNISQILRFSLVNDLKQFFEQWQQSPFAHHDLSELSWHFTTFDDGTCSLYDDTKKLITVNINEPGYIIHEIGHYLDAKLNFPSKNIKSITRSSYIDDMDELYGKFSIPETRYYGSSTELYARAFEAYCLKNKIHFIPFAQTQNSFLPKLNHELNDLMENLIKEN